MRLKYTHPEHGVLVFDKPITEVIFGRAHASRHVDIDLSGDAYVSRIHARIVFENEDYWIEDLGSRHGTWVEGERVTTKTMLAPGKNVQLGQTTVLLLSESRPLPDVPRDIVAAGAQPNRRDSTTSLDFGMEWLATNTTILQEDETEEQEGSIVTSLSEQNPPFSAPVVSSEQEAVSLARKFYEMSQALVSATSLDALLQILAMQLQQAIPAAQRGAVLLRDRQGRLLLKDHWPPGSPAVSVTLAQRACQQREAFIWSDQTDGPQPDSAIFYGIKSAIYVPLLWKDNVLGVISVNNHDTHSLLTVADLDLLRAFASQATVSIKNQMLQQDLQREEAARLNLLRQFPPSIASRMLRDRGYLKLSGEQIAPVTILVSDIRGFTTLSATMEPNDVVQMLNEMFSTLTPIIFDHKGIVDKYIGDAILAVFGSPETDDHQCEHAVMAALDMQHAMQELADRRERHGLPRCDIGIGIHTGAVVHGFVGSPERMEYTVIGDTVNQASRHCDGANPCEIIISRQVYGRVFSLVQVTPKTIWSKHYDTEGTTEAFVVQGLVPTSSIIKT
jgi:adenylate cyclase